MKKFKLLLICLLLTVATGCFKKDSFEDITIYTTVYPIEFITDYLYGDYSTIYSIYPDGVNTDSYELTKKQLKDYSSMDLYIFDGDNTKEAEYVTKLFNYNKNLKIIDAANTMEYNTSEKELWLDPSNFLMMALNIKNGILEYTTNHYLKNTIEENYNKLKIEISSIDANLKLMYENADNKVLVVDDDSLTFLEKYGFTVISLEENDNLTDKTLLDVKNKIKDGTVKYIYTTTTDTSDTINNLKEETDVEILQLYTIYNLTDEQRKNKETYISLLNEDIELLKNQLYN